MPIEKSDSKEEKHEKVGLAVVMTDVTEELDDINAKIESEKVSSIMDLAAGVAHELGNPLNSINIHLQLLKRNFQPSSNENAKSKKSLDSCIKKSKGWMVLSLISLRRFAPQTLILKRLNYWM